MNRLKSAASLFCAGALPLLALVLAPVSEARLGYSLQDCIDRYGEPVRKMPAAVAGSDAEAVVFRRDDTEYVVHFQQSSAWHIAYTKKYFSNPERQKILAENTDENNAWNPPLGEKVGNVHVWLTPGGHRWAALSEIPGLASLEVMTRPAAEAIARERDIRVAKAK